MGESMKNALFATLGVATVATIAITRHRRAQKNQNIHSDDTLVLSDDNSSHQTLDTSYELYPIDYSMHKDHRLALLSRFRARYPLPTDQNAVILLHGGDEISRYDTDTCLPFHQESFFQYLFGIQEPGLSGLIHISTGESILFIPRLSEEWELWCGKRKPTSYYQLKYQVNRVYYKDQLPSILSDTLKAEKIYVLHGRNLDSGLETAVNVQGLDAFQVNTDSLYPLLVECRVRKSPKELALLRFINKLSSKAHIHVMQTIEPNMMEFHAEAAFLHYCYRAGGARLHAYTCICGGGTNAATLHYGHAGAPNDKMLGKSDLLLNDMGAELFGYASDITCTFPVSGSFTADQSLIYDAVLHAHDAVIEAIKPGVSYIDMHLLSHRVLTEHLLRIGLFQNGTIDELMDLEVSWYFYPHGLGHLMGLDVHDVGGHVVPFKRSERKILSKLRLTRVLEENMVLTVEPGCYFIEAQMKQVMENLETVKYVNWNVLERLRGTGGVRIESNVIVTKFGAENMTRVPRTRVDVEAVMAMHV